MGNYLAEYSEEEFSEKLIGQLETMVTPACLSPHDRPQAVLLGGQSGAGKTTFHHVFLEMFKKDVIVVNGDEYRKLHPRFFALQSAYGDKAVDYTAQWAGKMVEAIVEALSSAGYNLVIEGTLRTSQVPLATATLLRERGYDVSLALMAVKPEISLVSCQLRYEQMRLAGTTPRPAQPIRPIIARSSTRSCAISPYSRIRACSIKYTSTTAAASVSIRKRDLPWRQAKRSRRRFSGAGPRRS